MISEEIYSSSKRFLLRVKFLTEFIDLIIEPLLMEAVLEEIHYLKKKFLVQVGFQGRAHLVKGVLFISHTDIQNRRTLFLSQRSQQHYFHFGYKAHFTGWSRPLAWDEQIYIQKGFLLETCAFKTPALLAFVISDFSALYRRTANDLAWHDVVNFMRIHLMAGLEAGEQVYSWHCSEM